LYQAIGNQYRVDALGVVPRRGSGDAERSGAFCHW
jgi:hypothetical protein